MTPKNNNNKKIMTPTEILPERFDDRPCTLHLDSSTVDILLYYKS